MLYEFSFVSNGWLSLSLDRFHLSSYYSNNLFYVFFIVCESVFSRCFIPLNNNIRFSKMLYFSLFSLDTNNVSFNFYKLIEKNILLDKVKLYPSGKTQPILFQLFHMSRDFLVELPWLLLVHLFLIVGPWR